MKHVMLDLETLGTTPGCVVLSIGAVEFDLDGVTGSSFYVNLLRDPQIKNYGLTTEASTIEWWSKQSDNVRNKLNSDQKHPFDAIVQFSKWFQSVSAIYVWSQGLNFDVPIFDVLRNKTGLPPLWKFYNARDTRTAYDIAGIDIRTLKRDSDAHDALADAHFQVKCVQLAIAKIRAQKDCF